MTPARPAFERRVLSALDARPARIHHPPHDRAQDGRHQEAERERARSKAALPTEFVDQRRHQQRECRPRGHADCHRHERDADDQPAEVERQPRRPVPGTAAHGVGQDTRSIAASCGSSGPCARGPPQDPTNAATIVCSPIRGVLPLGSGTPANYLELIPLRSKHISFVVRGRDP